MSQCCVVGMVTRVRVRWSRVRIPVFFFFNWLYNPWWVLACFTISFHNLLSLYFSLQFLTFVFFKSSSTCSSHLSLGRPTGLDENGSHSVSFLTVLIVSILITCASNSSMERFFFSVLQTLQTCSGAHPAFCKAGAGDLSR